MKASSYTISSIAGKNIEVISILPQPERGQNFLHISPDRVMWKMAYPLELPEGGCVALPSLNPEYDRLLADRLFDEIYEHPEGATAFINPLSGKMRDQLQALKSQLERSLQLLHSEEQNRRPLLGNPSAVSPLPSAAIRQEESDGYDGAGPESPAMHKTQEVPLWENVLQRESRLAGQRKKKEKSFIPDDKNQVPKKRGATRAGELASSKSAEVLLVAAGACLAAGFALGFLAYEECQDKENEKKKEPSSQDGQPGSI